MANAASQKRGPPGSDNGETGNSPPESSSRMPLHDGPTDGSSAAANRITTQASGASGLGNEETADLPPESSSRMNILTSFSSSAPAGHITTQASGLGNEETVDSSSSRMHGLTNGWGLSSSAPAGRITTHGAWGSDNGEAGGLTSSWSGSSPHDDPDEWSDRAWVDNAWLPASQPPSAAANHITTHRTKAPGALFWGDQITEDLPPDHNLPAPVPVHPLHDHLTKSRLAWVLGPDSPESSSRPWTSSSELSHSSPTDEWPWSGHVSQVSSPLERPSVAPPDQALGAAASSSSDSAQWAHSEDLPPPYRSSAPNSLAAPEADRFFGDTLTHSKALLYSGVAAAIGSTAALAYGIRKFIKLPYVSLLSCGHLAESQTF